MGINGLFPLLEASAKPDIISIKDLKGRSVAVDVSWLIHMFIRAGTKTNMLSDAAGKPTIHILQIINLIHSMKTAGVKGMIFVFDSPTGNPLKAEENAKRHVAREKAEAAAAAEGEEKETATGAFRITADITADCIFLIESLGMPYMVAGEGFEAEHVCAMLTQKGIADVVLTNDSDALTFGATAVARKNLSKATYSLHSLPAILASMNLTYKDFVKVCVVLGCDFAKKTKGIGVKTVLKKYKAIELTEEQQVAYDYFTAECPFAVEMIIRKAVDVGGLIAWLHGMGFSSKVDPKVVAIAHQPS